MLKLNSLQDTFIFKHYDESLKLKTLLIKMATESRLITQEDLEIELYDIERRYYFSSKNAVVSDFKSGKYKLIYNNKGYKMPNAIPAFLINTGKGISCLVNISNHAYENKEGKITIDTKALFALMQCGNVMTMCVEKFNMIIARGKLIRLSSEIYSKLFTKIINRMYSININPQLQDVIVFLSSYFFLNTVMCRKGENMKEMNAKYAAENCKSGSRVIVENVFRDFKDEDFKDLGTFIAALAENIPALEKLTARAFVDNYVSMYGPTMLMSAEYLPFFYYNLFAVVTGSYINKAHVLETTLGKQLDMLYNEFYTLSSY